MLFRSVEYHEIDVEVHENDEEMRNVEELVNENIEKKCPIEY